MNRNPRIINTYVQKWSNENSSWVIKHLEDHLALEKSFSFKSFDASSEFIQNVIKVSQKYYHYPKVIWEVKTVTLLWWTHYSKSIEEKDCKMCNLIDIILENPNLDNYELPNTTSQDTKDQ